MLSLSPKSKVVIQKEVAVKKPAAKKQKPNKDDDLIIYSLNTKSENQQTATMSRKTKSIPRKQLKKGAKLRKSVPKTTTGHKIVNIASGNQSEQVETQSAAVDQVILENDPSELFKEIKTPQSELPEKAEILDIESFRMLETRFKNLRNFKEETNDQSIQQSRALNKA